MLLPPLTSLRRQNSLGEPRELHRRPGPFRPRLYVVVAVFVVVAIAPRPVVRARAVLVSSGCFAFPSLAAVASAVAISTACIAAVAF